MEQQAWKGSCVVCKQEFEFPDFECKKQPGNHVLPTKLYFHPGGATVQDLRERRMYGPHVILKAGIDRMDTKTGEFRRVSGVEVNFQSGKYETSNAEEQYYLDHKSGLCDENRWNEVYLTPDQQLAKSKAELIDVQRRVAEQNTLLQQARQSTSRPQPRT